jgi:hypothetical protein
MKRIILIWVLFGSIVSSVNSQNAGQTLTFDGINDYVQTTYSGISGTNPRTVEAWINTSFKSTQEVIVCWGAMSPNGRRFTMNLINGRLRIEVGGNGYTSTTLVSDNKWHHVAVTFNNNATTKYNLYVDGNFEANVNLTVAANTANSSNVKIGIRTDNVNAMDGHIDEVRIWNTVLDSVTIRKYAFKPL